MFAIHFIAANLIICFWAVFTLIIRRFIGEKISPKVCCYIWFPVIFVMLFSLIPEINIYIRLPAEISKSQFVQSGNVTYGMVSDNYVEIRNNIYDIIAILWGVGVVIFSVRYVLSYCSIKEIIKNSSLYDVRDNVQILISKNISSPFSFGCLKKVIVLPEKINDDLSDNEIEYIILHELLHHKNKDIVINIIICILNILYWFNPAIYYVFEKLRLDIELRCDYCVLNIIGKDMSEEYGNTVLYFANKPNFLNLCNNFIGAKSQLKCRIEKIVCNNTYKKRYLYCFMALLLPFIILSCYIINIFGYNSNFSKLKNENIEVIDLSEYFGEYNGCFVLFNEYENKYIIYNQDMAEKRYSPYSTYKIAIAANAVKDNTISEDNSYISWNGTDYPFSSWNKGQDLESAMKYSVNWYFQNIDNCLGYNNIKGFLKRADYGNESIGFDIENYWLDGTLRISPIEQTQFLKYIFNQSQMDFVKNSIEISDGFWGKTGSGKDCGWFVGALDNNGRQDYFALYIKGDYADGANAYNILKNIIENQN